MLRNVSLWLEHPLSPQGCSVQVLGNPPVSPPVKASAPPGAELLLGETLNPQTLNRAQILLIPCSPSPFWLLLLFLPNPSQPPQPRLTPLSSSGSQGTQWVSLEGFFPSNRLNSSLCAWLPGGKAAAVPGSALPLSLPSWAGLEPALSGGMGSASPGLSALPPGRLAWPDPALLPPPRDPRSWGCPESPSPPSTPEQPLPAFCLHYFDMLYPEDTAWAAKSAGEPSHSSAQGGREEARKEPEQCPIIDSQGLGLGPEGDLQDSLHLEEHSLEQVQSMVVGEVLKDIETACKLLNIAAGGCSAGAARGGCAGSQRHAAFEGLQPCVRG